MEPQFSAPGIGRVHGAVDDRNQRDEDERAACDMAGRHLDRVQALEAPPVHAGEGIADRGEQACRFAADVSAGQSGERVRPNRHRDADEPDDNTDGL